MLEIKGKVVVITGASSGIGKATALLLAALGAKLVLAARTEESLALVAKEITGEVLIVKTDVKRRADLENLMQRAVERFGRVDVLMNNAGTGPISRLDELKVDEWEEMIDVNFKGVLYGIAAALPVFEAQQSGQIINIISTAGIQLAPSMAVYAATKNAVRTLTEILRLEAGPHLRVTGISPGFVKTNFLASLSNAEMKEQFQKKMDEIGLDPEAVARAVAYVIGQPAEVNVGAIVLRATAQR